MHLNAGNILYWSTIAMMKMYSTRVWYSRDGNIPLEYNIHMMKMYSTGVQLSYNENVLIAHFHHMNIKYHTPAEYILITGIPYSSGVNFHHLHAQTVISLITDV